MKKPALRVLKNVRYRHCGVRVWIGKENHAADMERVFGKSPASTGTGHTWPIEFKGRRFFVFTHPTGMIEIESAGRTCSEIGMAIGREFVLALQDALVPY